MSKFRKDDEVVRKDDLKGEVYTVNQITSEGRLWLADYHTKSYDPKDFQYANELPARVLDFIPIKQLTSLPYFVNRGTNFFQCVLGDDSVSTRERVYSDTLKSLQDDTKVLQDVVGDDPTAIKAALTMFQWLASKDGAKLLDSARRGFNEENR